MLEAIWLLVFALLWLGVVPILISRRASRAWLTLLGGWMTTGAFFMLPWLSFEPWRYAGSLTLDTAISALVSIVRWGSHFDRVLRLLGMVSRLFDFTGPIAVVALPSLNLLVRLMLLAVPVAGALALALTIVGGLARSPGVQRVTGAFQAVLSLATALLIISQLSALDSAATLGQFPYDLLPLLLGVQLGAGPWVALLGALALSVSGVWAWRLPANIERSQ